MSFINNWAIHVLTANEQLKVCAFCGITYLITSKSYFIHLDKPYHVCCKAHMFALKDSKKREKEMIGTILEGRYQLLEKL